MFAAVVDLTVVDVAGAVDTADNDGPIWGIAAGGVCVNLVSGGRGSFAERPDYRVLGFPCVLGVGGETLSPG